MNPEIILSQAKDLQLFMTKHRRFLHAHPELGFDLFQTKEYVKNKILEFMAQDEIMITKKNKKGKIVESDIRPMIKFFDILSLDDNNLTLTATIATGSKANLNTNIFIPKVLEMLDIEMDPLDVDILRRDLYVVENGELVSPM